MSARSFDLNLLPKEVWEKGIVGQLLVWVLSVGRYVVVFTELRGSLKNKQSIITASGDLENSFRLTQAKLTKIKTVSAAPRVLNALDTLSQMTPADAVFTNVTVNREEVD